MDLSNPHWARVAAAFPIPLWIAAPDGAILYMNERWQELTGQTPATVLGTNWSSIVYPGDLDAAAAAWSNAVATGTPFRCELRVRRRDGSYGWVNSKADPMRDGDGSIAGWIGVVVDVEDAHREREGLIALAETVPVVMWSAHANGWIEWYSRCWYEYTGLSQDESLGWGWQTAVHPDDLLELMRVWPHALETGEPFEVEQRLRGADGNYRWFLARGAPACDESGTVRHWYGSCADIHAQRYALARTKRVAETLQDVFLPKSLPQFADLRLDAVYTAAEKDALVGGDWFDAFELPDGRLVFSIGDVAGHGLDASVTVGRMRQAIFTLAWSLYGPGEILKRLDRILTAQEPGTIVTALVGTVDAAHATLQYASAGHPPPLIARSKTRPAEILEFGDPPLGAGVPIDPVVHSVEIERDAVVAFYTDGMTEFARDVDDAERKLGDALRLLVGDTRIARPAKAVQELVFDDRPATDDAALLLLQFSAVDPNAFDGELAPPQKVWRFHSSSAHSAQSSRREVMAYLRGVSGLSDRLFDVELVVGEIFANTVRHAPGLVEVRVDWSSGKAMLVVKDTGPGLDTLDARLPADDLSENGRGIFLIKTLAPEVSVKSRPGYGTELRVALPLPR